MIDLPTIQHWLEEASDSERREVLRTLTEKMLNGTLARQKVAVFDEAGHRVAVLQRENPAKDGVSDEERREITGRLNDSYNMDPKNMQNEEQMLDLFKQIVPEIAPFKSFAEILQARRDGLLP